MVKGISRQVIVVQSPDPALFDQAIFILKDSAIGQEGITDELLLKEASRLIGKGHNGKHRPLILYGAVWACGGALLTGFLWLISVLF